MSKKLMTLEELSQYLHLSEDKIIELVDQGVITAYRIGGELLRFRREHVDAVRREIDSRTREADKASFKEEVPAKARQKLVSKNDTGLRDSFNDKVADFFYFYDFYIVSSGLIVVLLAIIFLT